MRTRPSLVGPHGSRSQNAYEHDHAGGRKEFPRGCQRHASDGEGAVWRTMPRRRMPALWCCRPHDDGRAARRTVGGVAVALPQTPLSFSPCRRRWHRRLMAAVSKQRRRGASATAPDEGFSRQTNSRIESLTRLHLASLDFATLSHIRLRQGYGGHERRGCTSRAARIVVTVSQACARSDEYRSHEDGRGAARPSTGSGRSGCDRARGSDRRRR